MARRVITLKGSPIINEDGIASAAIVPGQFVDGVSSLAPGPSANGPGRNIALERDERGQDIDAAYASGEVVKNGSFMPGQRAYVFLASGQNVAENVFLQHGGSGLLIAQTSTNPRIGRSLEALDTTGDQSAALGPAFSTRIRVEIY